MTAEFELNVALLLLQRTPGVVRMLVEQLDPIWTDRDYGPQTWTVQQIVGHFIWGERTDWLPRARWILREGEAQPFEPFDRAGHEELCRLHSLQELLEIFQRERDQNLQELTQLQIDSAMLHRRGRHPALGTVTLGQLLATWVVHDLNHIAQVCKAMAFQYREAVGPWEQYLSILSPSNPR